jgi:hypothetical protein
MRLAPREPGEQHLQFGFDNKGNYLKVDLGQAVNGGIGAILTVQVDGSQFNLDLTTRSHQHFDLFLLYVEAVHELLPGGVFIATPPGSASSLRTGPISVSSSSPKE